MDAAWSSWDHLSFSTHPPAHPIFLILLLHSLLSYLLLPKLAVCLSQMEYNQSLDVLNKEEFCSGDGDDLIHERKEKGAVDTEVDREPKETVTTSPCEHIRFIYLFKTLKIGKRKAPLKISCKLSLL